MIEALSKIIADNPDKALSCLFSAISAIIGTAAGLLLGRWLQRAGKPKLVPIRHHCQLMRRGEAAADVKACLQDAESLRYTLEARIANPSDIPRTLSLQKVEFFASKPVLYPSRPHGARHQYSMLRDPFPFPTINLLPYTRMTEEGPSFQLTIGGGAFETVSLEGVVKPWPEANHAEAFANSHWLMAEFAISPTGRYRFWHRLSPDERPKGTQHDDGQSGSNDRGQMGSGQMGSYRE